ncbi:unnamed protein product [Effrenium voratum]|uniref:PUM-HD domain-containing protein n=1 Tax=Effrenium voratum TaxID=2562239 RepID=A0AA36J6T3_9DINO|nr:unnamed protein product [Effrenium voratum]
MAVLAASGRWHLGGHQVRGAAPAFRREKGRITLMASRWKASRQHKVALVLGFLGTKYCGSQIHYDEEETRNFTIEWHLRKALREVGALQPEISRLEREVEWRHSSRTDSGVHACRLVICARLAVGEPNAEGCYEALLSQLNEALPPDIRVLGARKVPKSFDARFSCSWREYGYLLPAKLFQSSAADVAGRIQQLLKPFVGWHCFHNFARIRGRRKGGDLLEQTVAKLEMCSADVVELEGSDCVEISLQGNRFLYNQIRYIAGALAAVAMGELPEKSLTAALRSTARFRFPLAPPGGLALRSAGFTGTRQKPCEVAMDLEQVYSRMLPTTTLALLDAGGSIRAAAFERAVKQEAARSWKAAEAEFRENLRFARLPQEDLDDLCATPRHLQPRAVLARQRRKAKALVWRERAPSPTPEVPEVPEVPAAAPEVEAMPEHLWIVFSEAPELEARWVYGRHQISAWVLRIFRMSRGQISSNGYAVTVPVADCCLLGRTAPRNSKQLPLETLGCKPAFRPPGLDLAPDGQLGGAENQSMVLQFCGLPGVYAPVVVPVPEKPTPVEMQPASGELAIAKLARNQEGAEYLSQLLASSPMAMPLAVTALLPELPYLASHPHGAVVVSDLFTAARLTKDTRRVAMMSQRLQGSLLRLTKDRFGCRVMQAALQEASPEFLQAFASELKGKAVALSQHLHANFVLQKYVELLPASAGAFILQELTPSAGEVAVHVYGCRVLQRLIEHCSNQPQLAVLIGSLLSKVGQIEKLLKDPFGSNVLRAIVAHGTDCQISVIMDAIATNVLKFSKHKHASLVFERCLETSSERPALRAERATLVALLLGDGTSRSPLAQVLLDRFGNYLAQRMIHCCRGPEEERIRQLLSICLPKLQRSPMGRHIMAASAKRFGSLAGA